MEPQRPSWPTPPESVASSARSRRRDANSSSDSERGPFGISCRKFRVAAPPARPLPLEAKVDEISRPVNHEFGLTIQDEAYKLLESYGVDLGDSWTDVSVVDRYVEGYPDTKQPTVLVTALWTPTSLESWPKIVTQLKQFVDRLTNNPTWRHVDIAVEMLAAELCAVKYLAPVVGNERLSQDWPQISDRVTSLLESIPEAQNRATSISLFHFGYALPADTNPITVYISVSYDCLEDSWPMILGRIQDELDKWPHKLVAFIEHGDGPEPFAFQLLPPKKNSPWRKGAGNHFRVEQSYPKTAQVGADLSVSTYLQRDDGETCHPPTGTLGCYLEVDWVDESEPGWKKLALTNYHVTRPAFDGYQVKVAESRGEPGDTRGKVDSPAPGSTLWKRDEKGFGPAQSGLSIEHPTRSWHNFTVSTNDAVIKNLANSMQATPGDQDITGLHHERTQLRRQHLAFFDGGHHHLGEPWAGSGLAARTTGVTRPRRLDWALVEVEASRQASNQLPARDFWMQAWSGVDASTNPFTLHGKPLRQATAAEALNTWKSGQTAYKIGAVSGVTVGVYNEYRSVIFMDHDRHLSPSPSYEHSFLGTDGMGPFATPGDSGAVVFNEHGQVVGVVFSGGNPQQTAKGSYALVTPIEDVFRHIKDLSQNRIRDVRIAL
ncbi:hypothetical protein HRG_000678 [Hirsutella rhossiliensis]|uniref:Uncharacterized protein n=1 Tax=Hirsutella rhossiliensis TaxID=111463 RepID=A0A9P8N8P7_9HYPO|nr:uncharacterized protein HRG_00678 [Hirsutella rhossiliensis]KAH0968036.1 hypothetical protein HRG_00678 [Hirsutella rhossiliensis]